MNQLNLLRKLTDVFTKKPDSNIGKLFLIISEQFTSLNESATNIENWRDIDQAEGFTLDLMGAARGQQRGRATDELMRVLIKARIARNNSDGTIDSMINSLALSLNTSPSSFRIKALWNEGQPVALMIDSLPLDALNKVGMTAAEFGSIAQSVTVSGMKVTSIDLTGTFAFSSVDGVVETSIEFGFAPLDQSTGGTLGASYDPNEVSTLPI
jgi:hypothetical protein